MLVVSLLDSKFGIGLGFVYRNNICYSNCRVMSVRPDVWLRRSVNEIKIKMKIEILLYYYFCIRIRIAWKIHVIESWFNCGNSNQYYNKFHIQLKHIMANYFGSHQMLFLQYFNHLSVARLPLFSYVISFSFECGNFVFILLSFGW